MAAIHFAIIIFLRFRFFLLFLLSSRSRCHIGCAAAAIQQTLWPHAFANEIIEENTEQNMYGRRYTRTHFICVSLWLFNLHICFRWIFHGIYIYSFLHFSCTILFCSFTFSSSLRRLHRAFLMLPVENDIKCRWLNAHTKAIESGAVYVESTIRYALFGRMKLLYARRLESNH